MDVQGKAAVITGGGTGVGRATALELARRGCSVLVNYSRSQAEAEATAAELRSLGVQAVTHQADVADDAACRAMMAAAVQALGRLDVLINSAGTTEFIAHDDLEKCTDEVWDRILGVNLKGPFHCARAAKEHLLASGGGVVINVSSVAGRLGAGSSIPYCASKGALDTLTVSLARALGPKIRVNGVAPGFITGRWLQKGLGRAYDRMKQSFEDSLPLGRVCDPEDVAAAIMGLVQADLITGQTLVVDGGMTVAKWNAVARRP
jgi:3-oxoacyl-[acyl-carrier protein] reductase